MTQTLGTIVADFETSLATAMAVGATSVTFLNATDDDGVALPTGKYYFTIDGNNASKEHIYCTLTGTSITDIENCSRQGIVTTGSVRAHRVGAKVTLTDFANLKYTSDMLNGSKAINATVGPLIYDAQPVISDDNHLATKKYIDDIAVAGSPDASTTVKGIAFMSTGPSSATGPIAVGSNDARLPTQAENDALAGTSGTPSSTNKFVTNDDTSSAGATGKVVRADATGKIGSSMLVGALPAVSGAALTGITDTQISNLNGYMSNASFTQATASVTEWIGRLTGPAGWRMAVLSFNADSTTAQMADSGLSLFATGMTSISSMKYFGTNRFDFGVSFSGATGTFNISTPTMSNTWSANAKLYFYR